MKRIIAYLLALVMILSMTFVLGSCRSKEGNKTNDTEVTQAASADAKDSDDADDAAEDGEAEDPANIVKTLEPDAEDVIEKDLPLQIEKVILYKNGSIRIIPTDDLKKNELGDSEADSIMPFAESGKIKDIYLCRIGNGGYRTIVALTEEGPISAVNTRALIEDHIVAVMDNLGGRDSFTGVEQEENEDGFSIIGKTEEGDDVILDPVILSDEEEEPQQVEQQ